MVTGADSPIIHRPTSNKGRTGRPRPHTTDRSILHATIELLTEGGLGAATVDAIAQRSGCAKTTVYRRWPSRDALILDAFRVAVRGSSEEVEEVREFDRALGSTIRGSARNIASLVQNPLFRTAFPMIAEELLRDTALGDQFRAQVFAPIRANLRGRLDDDIARGIVRADVDPNLVLDLVNGAVLYRALVGEPIDEGVADAIANLIETGTRASSPQATPPRDKAVVAPRRRT